MELDREWRRWFATWSYRYTLEGTKHFDIFCIVSLNKLLCVRFFCGEFKKKIYFALIVSTHHDLNNKAGVCKWHFQRIVLNQSVAVDFHFTKVCSWWFNGPWFCIASGNGSGRTGANSLFVPMISRFTKAYKCVTKSPWNNNFRPDQTDQYFDGQHQKYT